MKKFAFVFVFLFAVVYNSNGQESQSIQFNFPVYTFYDAFGKEYTEGDIVVNLKFHFGNRMDVEIYKNNKKKKKILHDFSLESDNHYFRRDERGILIYTDDVRDNFFEICLGSVQGYKIALSGGFDAGVFQEDVDEALKKIPDAKKKQFDTLDSFKSKYNTICTLMPKVFVEKQK